MELWTGVFNLHCQKLVVTFQTTFLYLRDIDFGALGTSHHHGLKVVEF